MATVTDNCVLYGMMALALMLSLSCKGPDAPLTEACSDAIGCVAVAPGAPLKIGAMQAMEGKSVALGTEQLRGIELAVEARGDKLLGHDIHLETVNSGCASETGANAALKIASNPDIVAVLGTTCSISAAAASKILSEAGMVLISGNNSAPFLTSMGGKQAPMWQSGYFRTANNDENAGKAAALYAYKVLGARRGATINDGDIYTRGLTEGFESTFTELGGAVVLATTLNKGDVDMSPILEAVRYTRANILFFPLFQPEGNRVLRQARQTPGLEDLVLMSDGALIEATFIADVGESGIGMFFVGPAKPDTPAGADLHRRYVRKFGVEPLTSYYLPAFDAAQLLFGAIEQVAVQGTGGRLSIGRAALRQALYATRNFQGVTGSLNCDGFGDCASPAFHVLRLDDPAKGLAGLEANVVFTFKPEP